MLQKYSLDILINYRIEVAGSVGESWIELFDQKTVSLIPASANSNSTILTGSFDQAGLLGLLRRLYYPGLPLISVNTLKDKDDL